MSLILGEQAGGSWLGNLQRPFEMAQPSSLGWSPHSSQLEIRGAELLQKPGPLFSVVPPKPPGLVLGIAWTDLPGVLQSAWMVQQFELGSTSMPRVWCSSLDLRRNLPGHRQQPRLSPPPAAVQHHCADRVTPDVPSPAPRGQVGLPGGLPHPRGQGEQQVGT